MLTKVKFIDNLFLLLLLQSNNFILYFISFAFWLKWGITDEKEKIK